jgi:hypothetical protein
MVELNEANNEKKNSYLSPEARKEAQIVSTRVWAQSMKLLQDKGVHIMNELGPSCKEIIIWKERPRNDEWNVDLIIMVDTFLSRQTRDKISAVEVFAFHKDEGGYVVK